MEPTVVTPEEIHAHTEKYINDCWDQGHPFDLPVEEQNRMARILAAALDAIIEESRLGVRWSPAQLYTYQQTLAHFVTTSMDRTGAWCRLTLSSGCVCMEFTLPHANELPSMDNRFWARLSETIDSHKLSYSSDENLDAASATKPNKSISKYVKAPVFALLTEFHIAYQHDPENEIRIGSFEKAILYSDSSWPEIVRTFSDVFKIMSQLSQSLYRSYYIKASNDPKRRLSVANLDAVNGVLSWIYTQPDSWTLEEASAAFPDAKKIDIHAAHDVALEQGVINTIPKPFRGFVRSRPS